MEEWLPHLTRTHIGNCAFCTQQEHPQHVNWILMEWLKNLPTSAIGQKPPDKFLAIPPNFGGFTLNSTGSRTILSRMVAHSR